MKTTIIPAQITSVEDKIAGSLSFSQILLLIAALFIATAIYAIVPKTFHLSISKVLLIFLVSGITMVLAIRIKGKVLFQWISIIATFWFRPRRYAFNKNDTLYRNILREEKIRKVKAHAVKTQKSKLENTVSIADRKSLEDILSNPEQNVRLAFSKKGGIRVSVSQQ